MYSTFLSLGKVFVLTKLLFCPQGSNQFCASEIWCHTMALHCQYHLISLIYVCKAYASL